MKKLLLLLINIALLATLAVLSGCVKRQGPAGEEPLTPVFYERAWIDPQIIFSDSLYTLIVAGRIDSFAVDTPVAYQSPSIGFAIVGRPCNVSVNLHDAYNRLIRPLLVRRLEPGYYKLTMDPATSEKLGLRPGPYLLRADVCGRPETAPITLQ